LPAARNDREDGAGRRDDSERDLISALALVPCVLDPARTRAAAVSLGVCAVPLRYLRVVHAALLEGVVEDARRSDRREQGERDRNRPEPLRRSNSR
jgi:hypothetical protein